MTDRPILFSAPMVNAILREIQNPGTGKTQTRRRLPEKLAPPIDADEVLAWHPPIGATGNWAPGGLWARQRTDGPDGGYNRHIGALPYTPGDRLWVKEAHFAHGHWDLTGDLTKTGKPERRFVRVQSSDVLFDLDPGLVRPSSLDNVTGWYARPSRFMFKSDSRITLDVTDVRVERLQDISGPDTIAEGVECETCAVMNQSACYRKGCWESRATFRDLWDSLNAHRAPWYDNPWVVAITFRPHLCNIADMGEAA